MLNENVFNLLIIYPFNFCSLNRQNLKEILLSISVQFDFLLFWSKFYYNFIRFVCKKKRLFFFQLGWIFILFFFVISISFFWLCFPVKYTNWSYYKLILFSFFYYHHTIQVVMIFTHLPKSVFWVCLGVILCRFP